MSKHPGKPAQTIGAREVELLLDEIRRYLDAVEVFRRAGSEPHWASAACQRR
jgi:predicted CoA-binding protein